MANTFTRRQLLVGSTCVVGVTLAGCSATTTLETYEADASNGPVFVMDDAVARPAGDDSFIDDLTGDKLKHFDLLFFVNKSPYGPYAQTMKILAPDRPGTENTAWRMVRSMEISTGREKHERYFTDTPRGIFTFDPSRRYRDYQSRQWDGAEMPFAMFWDYIYPNGRPTGIAFHSTNSETEEFLGLRSSGGCVRLSMLESEEIFQLVGHYSGMIPDFIDQDPRGLLQYASDGSLVMKDGFKVLVIVEHNNNIEWEVFGNERQWARQLKRNGKYRLYYDNPELFVVQEEEMAQAGQN